MNSYTATYQFIKKHPHPLALIFQAFKDNNENSVEMNLTWLSILGWLGWTTFHSPNAYILSAFLTFSLFYPVLKMAGTWRQINKMRKQIEKIEKLKTTK